MHSRLIVASLIASGLACISLPPVITPMPDIRLGGSWQDEIAPRRMGTSRRRARMKAKKVASRSKKKKQAMARKGKTKSISVRERARRARQSRKSWEQNNPDLANWSGAVSTAFDAARRSRHIVLNGCNYEGRPSAPW